MLLCLFLGLILLHWVQQKLWFYHIRAKNLEDPKTRQKNKTTSDMDIEKT